jgi:hypothetical protein
LELRPAQRAIDEPLFMQSTGDFGEHAIPAPVSGADGTGYAAQGTLGKSRTLCEPNAELTGMFENGPSAHIGPLDIPGGLMRHDQQTPWPKGASTVRCECGQVEEMMEDRIENNRIE